MTKPIFLELLDRFNNESIIKWTKWIDYYEGYRRISGVYEITAVCYNETAYDNFWGEMGIPGRNQGTWDKLKEEFPFLVERHYGGYHALAISAYTLPDNSPKLDDLYGSLCILHEFGVLD